MFDFGSILGSGTVFAQRHRSGNEYIFEQKPGWLTMVTLGLYVRPWMTIDYPDVPPSIGRMNRMRFDPMAWKPEYPNPAFANMRADDTFWAARIVSKFSDEAIRAVVGKAGYSDCAATDYVTKAMIARRDKVVAAWIIGSVPLRMRRCRLTDRCRSPTPPSTRRRRQRQSGTSSNGFDSTTPPISERPLAGR